MKTVMVPHFSTEREMAEALEAFLRKAGYQPLTGFRIRTWRPDFVAVRGNEVIIVVTAGRQANLRKALAQTAVYATDASSAYLAVSPSQAGGSLRGAARVLGVGLLAVGDNVRVVLKASVSPPRPSLLRRAKRALRQPPPAPHFPRQRASLPFDKVLRHRGILDTLLSNPNRKFTIRELSIEAHTPYATAWRIVEGLESLGAVSSERVGPSRHLSLNHSSPVVADLRRLQGIELSPHRATARVFAERVATLPAVQKAILFGSVAEHREATQSDIDVAIVLRRKSEAIRSRILEIATEVQDRMGMTVVPLLLTAHELKSRDQLAQAINSGKVLFERP